MKNPPHNIARVLSKLGHCSRAQAIELVQAGRVSVNGKIITAPGIKVDFAADIEIDGQKIGKKKHIYIILYKPAGYITSRSDERGRDTVYIFLSGIEDWVSPVGRLDKDSEGLLIFTNNNAFGDRMTHPMSRTPRTYEVTIDKVLSEDELESIRRGTDIGRGETSNPVLIRVTGSAPKSMTLEVTLVEGKNREVRRLFKMYDCLVTKLKRVSFGPFKLGALEPGEWQYFTPPAELLKPVDKKKRR